MKLIKGTPIVQIYGGFKMAAMFNVNICSIHGIIIYIMFDMSINTNSSNKILSKLLDILMIHAIILAISRLLRGKNELVKE